MLALDDQCARADELLREARARGLALVVRTRWLLGVGHGRTPSVVLDCREPNVRAVSWHTTSPTRPRHRLPHLRPQPRGIPTVWICLDHTTPDQPVGTRGQIGRRGTLPISQRGPTTAPW
jgi:hypothetical protein